MTNKLISILTEISKQYINKQPDNVEYNYNPVTENLKIYFNDILTLNYNCNYDEMKVIYENKKYNI